MKTVKAESNGNCKKLKELDVLTGCGPKLHDCLLMTFVDVKDKIM